MRVPAALGRRSSWASPSSCRSAAAGGRRSGSCSAGSAARRAARALKPVAARVRSDGPLLPPLSLGSAARIADRYLAPLAVVIRAMLPPGMLERLELVAEVTPARRGPARALDARPGAASSSTCSTSSRAARAPSATLVDARGPGGPAAAAPRASPTPGWSS